MKHNLLMKNKTKILNNQCPPHIQFESAVFFFCFLNSDHTYGHPPKRVLIRGRRSQEAEPSSHTSPVFCLLSAFDNHCMADCSL